MNSMSTPETQAEAQRAERILDRLMAVSDRGEIEWETGGPTDSYAADVGSMRLRVRSRDGNEHPPYVFEIWNNQNNLTLETESDLSEPELDRRIVALYQRGKRTALDPYKALRAVERELGLDSP
jgi:hypothetical protein